LTASNNPAREGVAHSRGETRFVRAVYLVTVITALLLALAAMYWGAFVLVWPCVVFIPALRAISRRIATGTVIPAGLVGERPVVAFVVTLAGVIAFFLKAIVATAALEIALAPEWPDEAGKIATFVLAAIIFDLIALLCGELALVGDGRSDSARASKSSSP
jgi:hypothetical protein